MVQIGSCEVIRNFLYLVTSVKGIRKIQLTKQYHMQPQSLCMLLMQLRSIGVEDVYSLI